MARIRYLKPDFFKDEGIKYLPFEARIFYAGLWCWADKEGRLEDRPERLKVEILPYDKVDVEKLLDLLSKQKNGSNRPFIQRYELEGERYIQILNWKKHQKPHHTESESRIPIPPNYIIPLILKDKDNIKGMGSVHDTSTELRNGVSTVKERLITHPPHVSLSPEEHQKLTQTYGLKATVDLIDRLNDYAGQFPKKFAVYHSHYATIRNWARRGGVKVAQPVVQPGFQAKKVVHEESVIPPTREDFAKLKAILATTPGKK